MSENERTNVTPIRPDVEIPQSGKRAGKSTLRLILMAVGSVLAILLICFLMFRDQLNPAKLKRNFTYSRNSDSIVFSYDEGKNNAYTVFQDSLAAVTASGLSVYDAIGTKLGTAQNLFSTPMLQSGDRLVLACDIGGSRVTAMDGNGLTVFDESLDGTILDADLSPEGAFCIVELPQSEKTVIHVYDAGLQEIFQWNSATRYMNQAAVSESGTCLCAVALGSKNGVFESTAVLFRTDSDTPVAEVSLGNQLILDLCFFGSDSVCAIGEHSVVCFGMDGQILGSYAYEGAELLDYAVSQDGFLALSLSEMQAGGPYTVVTLDSGATLLANRESEEELLSLTAAGGYCGILTPSCFSVYDRKMNLCAVTQDVGGTSSALILEDGSAILLGKNRGTLYLPN